MAGTTHDTAAATAVRWFDAAAEYAAAAEIAAADLPIPVLMPERADVAEGWARVFDRLYGRPVPARPGERIVVAWGPEAAAAGQVFAGASASRLVVVDSLDGVVEAVSDATETAAVVVGFAHRFTVAAVTRLTFTAGRPLGLLCGREEAALSFAVAKALLSPSDAAVGTQVFDAPSHRAADNPHLPVAKLLHGLRTPSLVKILRSHGEGGHAKYGGVVVCGLLDAVEFPYADDAGCRRKPHVCKRAEPTGAEVVLGDEIAAPVVCFLCCNGFNVAEQLYPSPVSMALALSEGHVGAVIAPARPLVVPDSMFAALREELDRGTSLGHVVTTLNRLSADLGQRDAFVLLGDPCQVVAPPAGRAGANHHDDHSELAALRTWLVAVLRHGERGRRVIRSLRSWLADRAEDFVAAPARRLDDVERLALYALKWAETVPTGDSLARLRRTATVIRLGAARWDDAVAQLLLDVRDSADAFDIGHYDQLLLEVRDGELCARCGTPTEVHLFGAGEPEGQHRTAVLCRVCGPVRESGASGPALVVRESPATVRGGGRMHIGVELTFPPGTPRVVASARMRLRFFDKAGDRCVHDETKVVPAEDGSSEFVFDLPDSLGVDLHSVRLVVVSGFDVAYARVRVAGLPQPRQAVTGR